jgi:transposase InsO family protein
MLNFLYKKILLQLALVFREDYPSNSMLESRGLKWEDYHPTPDNAWADIFDYIEVLYNRARRHTYLVGRTPEPFEMADLEQTRLSSF